MRDYEFLTEKNFNKLKEQVKRAKLDGKEIIYFSGDDDFNRKVAEKLDIDYLGISLLERKDFMKQRDSGFNEVLARILKKSEICLGVDFQEILKLNNRETKDQILSRLKQNIILCNKNRIQIKFFNIGKNRDEKGIKSLGLVLGMPTWMVKKLV
jgi:RNase P/RNase MRP subunit p30